MKCSICVRNYQINDSLIQFIICKHTFHLDCIQDYMKIRKKCPICKKLVRNVEKLRNNNYRDDENYNDDNDTISHIADSDRNRQR